MANKDLPHHFFRKTKRTIWTILQTLVVGSVASCDCEVGRCYPHVSGTVKAGAVWESVGVWSRLEEACLFFLWTWARFLGASWKRPPR